METNDLKKDIEVALKLLHKQRLTDEEFFTHSKIYPWSNEKTNIYYNYSDLTNKRSLCVTSSGDHILYAAAAGSAEIDSFDMNRLCKYYVALKIAFIKAYDKNDFFELFDTNKNKQLLNNLRLNDIKPFLSEQYSTFWMTLLESKAFKKNQLLFRYDGFPNQFLLDYNDLKKHLSKVKINYYDMEINDFINSTTKKYDAIFLSNILEWIDDPTSTFNNCYNLLNNNGILYDYHLKRTSPNDQNISPEKKFIVGTGLPGFDDIRDEIFVYRKRR